MKEKSIPECQFNNFSQLYKDYLCESVANFPHHRINVQTSISRQFFYSVAMMPVGGGGVTAWQCRYVETSTLRNNPQTQRFG